MTMPPLDPNDVALDKYLKSYAPTQSTNGPGTFIRAQGSWDIYRLGEYNYAINKDTGLKAYAKLYMDGENGSPLFDVKQFNTENRWLASVLRMLEISNIADQDNISLFNPGVQLDPSQVIDRR